MEENIKNVIKTLNEITYEEWLKIKHSVDYGFELKRKELERELKLTSDEIEKSIHSRFG